MYSKLRSEYRMVCNNVSDGFVGFDEDIELLQQYFPEVDVRKISEIEQFHRKLESILSNEIEVEKRRIGTLLEEAKAEKEAAEAELATISRDERISDKLVSRITDIKAEIDTLQKANDVYNKKVACQTRIDTFQIESLDVIFRQLSEIEVEINRKMAELNEYIYQNGRKAPIIHFNEDCSTYSFRTPNDSGTGTSCRGLILFDLAIMELTKLPILIHDSVIHKQIEDHAFNKLLDLYESSGKQVFIAMDKQDSFGEVVEKKLEDASVLHLSKGGNELYGRPWYEEKTK